MLEIEKLNKEAVYRVMRELLYTLNWLHVQLELLLRTKYPEGVHNEELFSLHERVGSYEANRLSRVLNIPGGGIDALMELVRHSHWAVFENIEVKKLTESSFTMRTIECSTQKAWEQWGMGRLECGRSNLLARSGFFKAANQKANVKKVFTPTEGRPESAPENVSCEWVISIEE